MLLKMNLERENILVLLNVYQERVFISYMPTHPDYLGVSQMRSWGPFLESPQYFSARKAVLCLSCLHARLKFQKF